MIFTHYFVFIKTDWYIKNFDVGMTHNFPQFLIELKELRLLASQQKSKDILSKLIYYEHSSDQQQAENRLTQIKAMAPSKRNILIERQNPFWRDLGEEWFR